jgi:hypothetical protein
MPDWSVMRMLPAVSCACWMKETEWILRLLDLDASEEVGEELEAVPRDRLEDGHPAVAVPQRHLREQARRELAGPASRWK